MLIIISKIIAAIICAVLIVFEWALVIGLLREDGLLIYVIIFIYHLTVVIVSRMMYSLGSFELFSNFIYKIIAGVSLSGDAFVRVLLWSIFFAIFITTPAICLILKLLSDNQ